MHSRNSWEIKNRIVERWKQVSKSNVNNLSENINGASPPSVFVVSYAYPKVYVGPMVSSSPDDTTILDYPEKWAGKAIEDILGYKLSLIRGTFSTVTNPGFNSNRHIESLQELAMSNKSTAVEVIFEKKPNLDFNQDVARSIFNLESIQFGLVAKVKDLKLPSSVTVNKKIEKVFYDNDLKAKEGINILYNEGIEVSKLSKILSMGMIGVKKNRKLVPTKWSISATDQIISADLIKKLIKYPSIDSFKVYKYSHLGNYFSVILIPDELWSFEMLEGWLDSRGNIEIGADYENMNGLNHYPTIGGSYFAARLAVCEFLSQQRRNASVIVLREVHPEYIVPVGVWQIREGIRAALKMDDNNNNNNHESLEMAFSFACKNLTISKKEWDQSSLMKRERNSQSKISDYFNSI